MFRNPMIHGTTGAGVFLALLVLLGTGCQQQTEVPRAAQVALAEDPLNADDRQPAQDDLAQVAVAPAGQEQTASDSDSGPAEEPGQQAEPQPSEPEQAVPQQAEPEQADEFQAEDEQQPAGEENGEADEEEDRGPANPFAHRVSVPDFPKDMTWINCGGPLRKQDLKGKFVLLDFWTYCCINCLHVLPELKKLEHAYPDELVVIGVHSAKFTTEQETENIEKAVLRYNIEHPVVNDWEHKIWNSFGVRSWPTAILIDPEGYAVWGKSGEFTFEQVDPILKAGLPYYRHKGLLDETPIHFDLLAHRQQPTPLRFPGKVLADEASDRLLITDTNHNRIVITTLDGRLLETIGSGAIGREDGDYSEATFDHPHGLALHGDILYVADTENHLLRKIDLRQKRVSTIAGTGVQSRNPWPGAEGLTPLDEPPDRWVGDPQTTPLNSPWALWVHQDALYIAMAGPHQIWKMPLDESEIGPYAGNGREDIVDGPLLPKVPYQLGYSSFAQPSGLASDGQWLFVADSEGSSIRAVPFDPQQQARTVVGTAHLPRGRLFVFGDQDGDREQARLQHPLCVAYHDGQIYVADTYNNKIKVVDAETGHTRTLASQASPDNDDQQQAFDEPSGVSYARGKLYVADTNNHRIRTIDLESGRVETLEVTDLEPPSPPKKAVKPSFPGAVQVQLDPVRVKPQDGQVRLDVQLKLPEGWKINPLAPMRYLVEAVPESGPIDRSSLGQKPLDPPNASFVIDLPTNGGGEDLVKLSMNYYYCQEGAEGLCKVGSVVWTVPLQVTEDAETTDIQLQHSID